MNAGWISVTEQMPQPAVDVLIYRGDKKRIGFASWLPIGGSGCWQSEDSFFDGLGPEHSSVTHWMPLPAPPTDAK